MERLLEQQTEAAPETVKLLKQRSDCAIEAQIVETAEGATLFKGGGQTNDNQTAAKAGQLDSESGCNRLGSDGSGHCRSSRQCGHACHAAGYCSAGINSRRGEAGADAVGQQGAQPAR
ncbi:hypothetical protein D3C78_872790 [compost metagenome]